MSTLQSGTLVVFAAIAAGAPQYQLRGVARFSLGAVSVANKSHLVSPDCRIHPAITSFRTFACVCMPSARRKASYYMAAQFVPKFLSIPAESVPFLLLAYFKYARPLKASFKPLCGNPPAGMTPDDLCHAFYMNETAGSHCRTMGAAHAHLVRAQVQSMTPSRFGSGRLPWLPCRHSVGMDIVVALTVVGE